MLRHHVGKPMSEISAFSAKNPDGRLFSAVIPEHVHVLVTSLQKI
jgi:hypothetical protein